MNGKMFGLYSLENAVYFGTEQYVHLGESVFFGKKPQWANSLKVFDCFSIEQGFDKNKKAFVTAFGLSEMLSVKGLQMLVSEIGCLLAPDSSLVFDAPANFEYREIEKALSLSGFLIYEEQKTGERGKVYLAVKKQLNK